MLVSEAKSQLDELHEDSHVAIMLIGEEEVREVCGKYYKHTARLLNMLCRRIDGSFWYEHRDIFEVMISKAQQHIEHDVVSERISDANLALQNELGLKRLYISLDTEIRPMSMVSLVDVDVEALGWGTFILTANSTYADLLRILDTKLMESDDHHLFLESINLSSNGSRMGLSFGS